MSRVGGTVRNTAGRRVTVTLDEFTLEPAQAVAARVILSGDAVNPSERPRVGRLEATTLTRLDGAVRAAPEV